MLLYGHNLYGVVAVFLYAGQHVFAEFLVCSHAFLLLAHTYVTFVDEQRRGVGLEALVVPCKGAFGGIDLGREDVCVGVLHHTCGVGRYAFAAAAGPFYKHLVELSVGDGVGREGAFPYARQAPAGAAEPELRQGFPAREVADECYG